MNNEDETTGGWYGVVLGDLRAAFRRDGKNGTKINRQLGGLSPVRLLRLEICGKTAGTPLTYALMGCKT